MAKSLTKALLLASAMAIAACGKPPPGAHAYDVIRIGPGDLTDAASTAYALSKPDIVEGNPLLEPFGDAAPVAAIGLKYGMKHLMVKAGATPARANVTVETAGLGASCANIATATSAAPAVSVVAFAGCWAGSHAYMKRKYERETGRTIDGAPIRKAVAVRVVGNLAQGTGVPQ